MTNKPVVISLGGSMIVPQDGQIDVKFLRQFKKIILQQIKAGQRFIIVAGGGRTARLYQQSARQVGKVQNDDLDWLGIHSTRLNAHLLRTIFKDQAEVKINDNPTKVEKFSKSVLIGAGWKPGCSTDYDAVLLAQKHRANIIINLSNIDHVYDRDPQKYKHAKKLENISWSTYRKLIGKKWSPGANWPFDPIASALAQDAKMSVVVINGKNLANFWACLKQQKFIGTTISG